MCTACVHACRQLAVVKMCAIKGRFDDDFTIGFTEFTSPVRVDEKHDTVIVIPVREETFVSSFSSSYIANCLKQN